MDYATLRLNSPMGRFRVLSRGLLGARVVATCPRWEGRPDRVRSSRVVVAGSTAVPIGLLDARYQRGVQGCAAPRS
ncbi:hypothetical protein APASM_2557 [Actinosynnema pretiosum subsp. pretiosum]|nr:hypothetical protein APASM_2557 [Actinosynnema pretiosum subsp. pretiosum]